MYTQNILNNAVGVIFSVHSGGDGRKGAKAVNPLGAIYSLLPPYIPQQLLHLENKDETPPSSPLPPLTWVWYFLGEGQRTPGKMRPLVVHQSHLGPAMLCLTIQGAKGVVPAVCFLVSLGLGGSDGKFR